jgi:hypothetical protein
MANVSLVVVPIEYVKTGYELRASRNAERFKTN